MLKGGKVLRKARRRCQPTTRNLVHLVLYEEVD